MTNLRDYDRDATLIEKVRDLERQLADARESLDIAYAKGLADGRAEIERLREALQRATSMPTASEAARNVVLEREIDSLRESLDIAYAKGREDGRAEIERLRGALDKVGLSLNITRANIDCVLRPDSGMAKAAPKPENHDD